VSLAAHVNAERSRDGPVPASALASNSWSVVTAEDVALFCFFFWTFLALMASLSGRGKLFRAGQSLSWTGPTDLRWLATSE
jgi:hypothetical protein